jgi:hypothetical protein
MGEVRAQFVTWYCEPLNNLTRYTASLPATGNDLHKKNVARFVIGNTVYLQLSFLFYFQAYRRDIKLKFWIHMTGYVQSYR